MLKNISKLEVSIENKVYQFLCDVDSPLQGAKEAVFQMLSYLGKIEENLKAQQAQVQAQQAQAAPPVPDVSSVPVEVKKDESKFEELKHDQSSI